MLIIIVIAIALDLFPLRDLEQLEENCSSLHWIGIGNIVKNDERGKGLRKSSADCLCFGLPGRASGTWHTEWQHTEMSPYTPPSHVPCAPPPKAENGCHTHYWALGQLVCCRVKCVACAHICKFHDAKAFALLASQAAKWFIKQRLQHLCLFVNKSGPCHAKRFF